MEDSQEARRRQIAAGAQSDPTGWFDPLYAKARSQADTSKVPWSRGGPHPVLTSWLTSHASSGSAMVTGCGLGDDAAALAACGYNVTAFDVSAQAITWCRERFGAAEIAWEVADLIALPAAWTGAFDLVIENRTVQALPPRYRSDAVAAVAGMVAPGGTLLAICGRRPNDQPATQGPPWLYREEEMDVFAQHGLSLAALEVIDEPGRPSVTLRAVYRHP